MPDTLIVRLPNWLGDTVMAVPALRALRAARPDSRVVLVGPWATLLAGQGLGDVLVAYARTWSARLAKWDELRAMRGAFLSQHIFKTYSGYVLSQFRRMAAAVRAGNEYKPKHAMHLVRLLHSGIHALRTGEILVDASTRREELLRIKWAELSFDEVKQRALALEREFQAAFETTALPEQPDFARVNDFLIRARRSMVDV